MINELRKVSDLAGEILITNFRKITDEHVIEKEKNDFVTQVDKESELLISSLLLEQFPDIPVLGEEFGHQKKINKSEMYWVLDPLDGTKNFIQQIPYFCISIALIKKSKPVVGCIYDPIHNEFFYSEYKKGAYLNGQKISVSQRSTISHGFIATGFPFRSRHLIDQYLEVFKEIFESISNMRRCGSAALDLAYVASGRYDAFFEKGLKVWDIAAGSLMVTESGGRVTDFFNGNNFLSQGHIIAGETKFHQLVLNKISNHFKKEDFLNV